MTIWINATLDEAARTRLETGLAGRDVIWATAPGTVLEPGAADPALAGASVAFGQPDPAGLLAAASLRLVQLSSAGWARYDRDDLRAVMNERGAALCSASSVFADPVAEHVVAMILALLRRLPDALDEQRGTHRWRYAELRAGSRLLAGETVLLLGYGSIAERIVARLRPFGAVLLGYRRTPRGDEGIPIVDRTGLGAALEGADHIVDLLPEGPATAHFVDAALLARCKPGARFYNVGRGGTVDQDALITALRSGQLDAAWLDVTTPEPLPASHPLWATPGLYVTPHSAGGHAGEQLRYVEHFLANLAALEAGQPLRDRVR